MRFSSPDESELLETAKNVDWTVGAPTENIEFSEEEMSVLENQVQRIKNGRGERDFIVDVEHRADAQSDARNFRIDLALLQKILYEHRRYALAQGFSDAEMDVLRAIEFHDEKRVGVDEVMEDFHAEEYSESTVYKALRTLQEKELISKVRPGLYQYTGP